MTVKLKPVRLIVITFGLILGIILSFSGGNAFADPAAGNGGANYSPGTCVLTVQGQGQQTGPCTTIAPGIKNDNGKPSTTSGTALDPSKCYDIVEGLSTQSIVEIDCATGKSSVDGSIQMCDVNGQTVACQLCQDKTLAPNNDPTQCKNPTQAIDGNCKDTSLQKCDLIAHYIQPALNFFAALVGLAVVISIIIGGIQYSSSAGDPQKAAAARARIRNAIIALITFFFLYAILNFVLPGGIV